LVPENAERGFDGWNVTGGTVSAGLRVMEGLGVVDDI
jgi:hypothetical protein